MANVFMCGRRAPAVNCSSCSLTARATCQFELFGSKAGQKCDRAICREHSHSSRPGSATDKKPMCRTHHKMTVENEARR